MQQQLLRRQLFVLLCSVVTRTTTATLLDQARKLFAYENEVLRCANFDEAMARFNYESNATTHNEAILVKLSGQNKLIKAALVKRIQDAGYKHLPDEQIQRQIRKISLTDDIVLGPTDFARQQQAIAGMQRHFGETTVCVFTNRSDCTMPLEPQLTERFASSRDPQELAWYWQQWYDKAGTPLREKFTQYVKYGRQAAKLHNSSSRAEDWLAEYEDPNFEEHVDAAYQAILPLYRELHAYVRYRLWQTYGDSVVPTDGHIPLLLLGNVWGQTWQNIFDIVEPYPEAPTPNVTSALLRQNYTVRKMVERGDSFFQSLGMRPLPDKFWQMSIFTRPENRTILCHASTEQFSKKDYVAIRMCAEVNEEYFYVIHHELGHVAHMLAYAEQPVLLQTLSHLGFEEAIGDTVALAVGTIKHLKRVGLLNEQQRSDERSEINSLLLTALRKIALMPFAYVMDKYRYAIFRDELNASAWNTEYWRMRAELTGLAPPVKRTELDFDPTAKYHVCADVEYFRYFTAHIFQFQFLRTMCRLADDYEPNNPEKPLHGCDFYGSKKAGKALRQFLALGDSRHWKYALKEFTGETEMKTDAILAYFAPLYEWLKTTNSRLHIPVGWPAS